MVGLAGSGPSQLFATKIEKSRYSNRTIKNSNRAVSRPSYKAEYSNYTHIVTIQLTSKLVGDEKK